MLNLTDSGNCLTEKRWKDGGGLGLKNPENWINLPENELLKKRNDSLIDIKKHSHVENEELINDGNGLYLTTIENFADFELHLEYKTVAKADSGIYLRGYPQVQIWDTTEAGGKWKYGAQKGSGGLWNNRPGKGWAPLTHADKPFGEWNHFRIIMKGIKVSVWLNQTLVVDEAPLVNYWHRKNSKGRLLKRAPYNCRHMVVKLDGETYSSKIYPRLNSLKICRSFSFVRFLNDL